MDTGQSNPKRFPGVAGAAVRYERERSIIGFERFMDRHLGQMKPEQAIPRFWADVFPRMKKCRSPYTTLCDGRTVRIQASFGPAQNFNYVAGVEREPVVSTPLPDGMTERTIPAREYVVITYRGTANGLGQAWD